MLVEFSLKPLYSSMSGKNSQIYGVHIPGKCIDSLDALMIDALQWIYSFVNNIYHMVWY